MHSDWTVRPGSGIVHREILLEQKPQTTGGVKLLRTATACLEYKGMSTEGGRLPTRDIWQGACSVTL